MTKNNLRADRPIVELLDEAGYELDQRMLDALRIASAGRTMLGKHRITDAHILLALCYLNARGCSDIPITAFAIGGGRECYYELSQEKRLPVDKVRLFSPQQSALLFERAAALAYDGRTVGTTHFLQALLQEVQRAGGYTERPYSIDVLANAFCGGERNQLGSNPSLNRLLSRLQGSSTGTDDYDYMLCLQRDRIVIRIANVLDDYYQESSSGLLVPHRALISKLAGIGIFTVDQILELEELLNHPDAREDDFQRFFERWPHFLRKWDHREVHPHVYLTREEDGPLIPDFILTNREAQSAAILELKRPHPMIVRH